MSVELIDSMGDDARIVDAARVSYAKRSIRTADGSLHGADAGLINFLIRERHGTPFEMVSFTFRVRCPIGVAREFQRHRIASFNEESTRYIQMRPDFYVPEPEDVRAQVGKSGAYHFEPLGTAETILARDGMSRAYEAAYRSYQLLLELGVAKELARNVLPLGLLTEFIVVMNLRSIFNFLSLRTAPTALLEIRREAQAIEQLITPIVPVTMAAWNKHGRQAV